MMFVATLTHPPDLCFGNKQYQADGREWAEKMRDLAKKHNVKIHGAYLSPNEHTFYFVLEADSLMAISELLGPPMLNHHSARISPVITVEEVFGLSFAGK